MSEFPIFPEPPSSARSISGGTWAKDEPYVVASGTTVSITRTVQPLFVAGSAGRLVWSATVTVDQPVTSVTFRMASDPARRAVTRGGVPASAVLEIPAGDAEVTLQIVVVCPVGALIIPSDRWLQVPVSDVGIMGADLTFGDVSPNGVPAPPPSAGLPLREAASAGRRSPQVRAAQAEGSRRPDVMARASSLL